LEGDEQYSIAIAGTVKTDNVTTATLQKYVANNATSILDRPPEVVDVLDVVVVVVAAVSTTLVVRESTCNSRYSRRRFLFSDSFFHWDTTFNHPNFGDDDVVALEEESKPVVAT
jgi:hypothetical protein